MLRQMVGVSKVARGREFVFIKVRHRVANMTECVSG